MPTTRRSTRSSTLSFKHKVTKAIQTGKEGYKSPARAKEYIPEPTPEPSSKATKPSSSEDDEDQLHTPAASDDEHEPEQAAQTAVADNNTKSDEETKAAKITDRAIERYWAGIEASRSAKEVHKKHGEGLTTGEKVLRYFDVSSQYGVRIIHYSTPLWLRYNG